MRYIGVRSSKCLPEDDTSYWGSSKHLPDDVQSTHTKTIIKEHKDRKAAVAHEVFLHSLYDVGINPNFYNKAKQLTTGFDTQGIPMTEEAKAKIAEALKGRVITEEHQAKINKALKGRVISEEHRMKISIANLAHSAKQGYKNPRKGVTVSAETRRRNSESKKADSRPAYVKAPRFKPWFITSNGVSQLFYTVTKQEYALEQGVPVGTYRDLATKSKGVKPIARGKYKGLIVGNIPT